MPIEPPKPALMLLVDQFQALGKSPALGVTDPSGQTTPRTRVGGGKADKLPAATSTAAASAATASAAAASAATASATAASKKSSAASTASAAPGKLLANPGYSGGFLIKDVERSQADVGDFLLVEGNLGRGGIPSR
jgi:hypothetical protein